MDEVFYTKALKFLSRRPRSEYEIRENLKKKHVPEDQIALILSRLREQKFVNDYDFAKWWVEQRTQFRPKGWRVLSLELQQKGISKEILKSIHEEMTFDNEHSEKVLAMKILQKKMEKYKGLSRQELYQKLGGFLARRGFSLDIIKACIDDVLRK